MNQELQIIAEDRRICLVNVYSRKGLNQCSPLKTKERLSSGADKGTNSSLAYQREYGARLSSIKSTLSSSEHLVVFRLSGPAVIGHSCCGVPANVLSVCLFVCLFL